jgi:hypothetical protein
VAPWNSVPVSDQFVSFLYEEYGKATGLPTDARTSVAMADYYAFDSLQYRHAVNPHVPSAILEMGFVTSPLDRVVLATQQERLAWGIANAVDRYFRSGVAGATPSPYPSFTPTRTPTRSTTPTITRTFTPLATATATATGTPTPSPAAGGPAITGTVTTGVLKSPTRIRIPGLPTATYTPLPTPTPLTGTITSDGRWLPPSSPNGRFLPPPGSNAPPVLLDWSDDDPHGGSTQRAIGWRPFVWYQYYVPSLGRSIWVKGERVKAKE